MKQPMNEHVAFLLKYCVESEISVLLDAPKCQWLLDQIAGTGKNPIEVHYLRLENQRLKEQIASLNQCVEDVCIGTKLECAICNEFKPCRCDKS